MSYSVDQFKAKVSSDRGLARSNLFVVQLPAFGEDGGDLNIMCKATQIPGKVISTAERAYGVLPRQVATGAAFENISLVMHLSNTYKIKKYFDDWQNKIVDNNSPNTVGWYSDYASQSIIIRQLRKGESFATLSIPSPIDLPLPSIIKDRLPTLGLPNIGGTGIGVGGVDVGDILTGGNLNLAIFSKDNVVYECELFEAYPTRISAIELSNELDGLVELTVDITYHKWVDLNGATNNRNIGDTVNDAIDSIFGAAINATGLSGFIQ